MKKFEIYPTDHPEIFDTNMTQEELLQDIAERDFLKSLGLYWRKWPEEKPEQPMECIVKTKQCGLGYGSWEDVLWGNEIIRQEWDTTDHLIAPDDGDQWLPLSALEVLK